ncbi:MAG: four helix bundle protein [bacterium]|nr:four helix bundle protein [bacterium]
MEGKNKIQSFTDLEAWREGHQLVLMIYEITRSYPKQETFGLVSQMRRSAVSITSNIAEGFSRQSWKEKTQFYYVALASVTELQNQLLISRDIHYLKNDTFQKAAERSVTVKKILSGLISKTKTRIQ